MLKFLLTVLTLPFFLLTFQPDIGFTLPQSDSEAPPPEVIIVPPNGGGGSPPPLPLPEEGIDPETKAKIASSPNPVGSGARALGMGGAHIAAVDDPTAASWNPAGLIRRYLPFLGQNDRHFSIVFDAVSRTEDNTFADHPEGDNSQDVFEENINFMSFTKNIRSLFGRPAVVSVNYQHLYDFSREWHLNIANSRSFDGIDIKTFDEIDYLQSGGLSALGVALAVKPFAASNLSVGLAFNYWGDEFNNEWEERLKVITEKEIKFNMPPGQTINDKTVYVRNDKYIFEGFNANIGLLWEKNDFIFEGSRLDLGCIVKLPFTADLKHEWLETDGEPMEEDEEMDMPMSYGIGVAYTFPSENLIVDLDVYRTEWDDFIIRNTDSGRETSPITGRSPEASDIDATYQVRLGAEYMLGGKDERAFETGDFTFPIRGGLFYDPAPALGGHDDYYGVSLGFGIRSGASFSSANLQTFALDVSYQLRFSDDVGNSIAPDYELSQEIREHTVYTSFSVSF